MSATPCFGRKVINITTVHDFDLIHLVKARVGSGEVEVGLVLVLEEVLDVTHFMIHSDEVLLVDPCTLLDAEVLKAKLIKSF